MTPSHLKYQKKPKRQNRITILLNDSEMKAIDRFCEKYEVSNRSRVIREALMRSILRRFDEDGPTLFD